MRNLTPAGQQLIEEAAQRHGFSTDAVMSMLESVIRGNGSMAQSRTPNLVAPANGCFGGMTMVSDMFNNYLKGRVDGLCSELSRLIASQPDMIRSGSFQSQSQGIQRQDGGGLQHQQSAGYGGSNQQQTAAGPVGHREPVCSGRPRHLWRLVARRSLGSPTVPVLRTTSAMPSSHGPAPGHRSEWQGDGIRHARSPDQRVLAAAIPRRIPHLCEPARPGCRRHPPGCLGRWGSAAGVAARAGGARQHSSPSREADVFATIEKLAQLHAKGILSEEEFSAKKAELLSRL